MTVIQLAEILSFLRFICFSLQPLLACFGAYSSKPSKKIHFLTPSFLQQDTYVSFLRLSAEAALIDESTRVLPTFWMLDNLVRFVSMYSTHVVHSLVTPLVIGHLPIC